MQRYLRFGLVIFISLLGCAPSGTHIINTSEDSEAEADKQLIVDCLLPGQIKKLGAGTTYVTPRRPAKLTAQECASRGGEYVAYDQANSGSALKVWLPAAQEGDVIAQVYVGEIYEKGMGIAPDYTLAAQWYKKAADQGSARAKLNLGSLYERGLGVQRNVVTALTLYREASGLQDTGVEFTASVDQFELGGDVEQLRALKSSLEQERKETQVIQAQLDMTIGQYEQKRKEMEANNAKLEVERKKLEQQRKEEKRDSKNLQQLEQALEKEQQDIEKRRKELAVLNSEVEAAKEQLVRVKTTRPPVAIAGPAIQMINPSLVTLRGKAQVNVPKESKTREIIGRVEAPAGLRTLTVNRNAQAVNENGVFRALLEIADAQTPVRIVAVDEQGKRAEIEFAFVFGTAADDDRVAVTTSDPAGDGVHNYALVIGNNNYTQFAKLDTAQTDAQTVADVLTQRYGFKTTTLLNANRYSMLAALNRLGQKMGDKDNLIIYYAGHGELDKEVGYWLPVDADTKDKRKWIPNNAITDIINTLPAKRVLVIADSCYSGALTRSSVPRADSTLNEADRLTWLRAVAKSRARLALTSGGLKPVADSGGGAHSLFANVFLNVLNENRGVLEGQRLYQEVAARIATNPLAQQIGQRPQYAPIRHAGHESGEFFFLPRRSGA